MFGVLVGLKLIFRERRTKNDVGTIDFKQKIGVDKLGVAVRCSMFKFELAVCFVGSVCSNCWTLRITFGNTFVYPN